MGIMGRKFNKVWTCGFGDMLVQRPTDKSRSQRALLPVRLEQCAEW